MAASITSRSRSILPAVIASILSVPGDRGIAVPDEYALRLFWQLQSPRWYPCPDDARYQAVWAHLHPTAIGSGKPKRWSVYRSSDRVLGAPPSREACSQQQGHHPRIERPKGYSREWCRHLAAAEHGI